MTDATASNRQAPSYFRPRVSAAAIALAALFATAGLAGRASPARADCVWEGTAPACNGTCKPGFKLIKTDKKGDGKTCLTGKKAYCCPDFLVITRGKAPFCDGECKPGETLVGYSDTGENGNKCTTGKAVQCINSAELKTAAARAAK
jgi:hypothetical protein